MNEGFPYTDKTELELELLANYHFHKLHDKLPECGEQIKELFALFRELRQRDRDRIENLERELFVARMGHEPGAVERQPIDSMTQAAALIFGVSTDEVTPEMRTEAKKRLHSFWYSSNLKLSDLFKPLADRLREESETPSDLDINPLEDPAYVAEHETKPGVLKLGNKMKVVKLDEKGQSIVPNSEEETDAGA